MTILIEFFGTQRTITKKDSIDMPINHEARVHDALEYVCSVFPDLHLEEDMIVVTVNHKIASRDKRLRDNDAISFLPYISGG